MRHAVGLNTEITIFFHAAINHLPNGHLKAELTTCTDILQSQLRNMITLRLQNMIDGYVQRIFNYLSRTLLFAC